jgi:hypothetical protein
MAETKRQYNPKAPKSLRDLNFNQMAKDFRTPALMIAGMAIGNFGVKQLNKVIEKPSVSGLLGVDPKTLKKYIAPTVSAVTGLAVYQLMPNKDIKAIGLGIAATGGILAFKEITEKNILSGLEGTPGLGNALPGPAPVSIEQVSIPGTSPLDLPLYEIDERRANPAFSRLMEDPDYGTNGVQGHQQVGTEKEIVLNSRLEDDNITDDGLDNGYDSDKSDLDMSGTDNEISGDKGEIAPMATPYVAPQGETVYQAARQDGPEETLDFSEIP